MLTDFTECADKRFILTHMPTTSLVFFVAFSHVRVHETLNYHLQTGEFFASGRRVTRGCHVALTV